jgi:hypothetical protein
MGLLPRHRDGSLDGPARQYFRKMPSEVCRAVLVRRRLDEFLARSLRRFVDGGGVQSLAYQDCRGRPELERSGAGASTALGYGSPLGSAMAGEF